MDTTGTIVAPATAPGGALTVIRVSGPDAIALCDGIFRGPGGPLAEAKGYTLHWGHIVDGRTAEVAGRVAGDGGETASVDDRATECRLPVADGQTVVDEVLVSVFRAPRSYTGEDMVEISCHGSAYIRSEVVRLLVGRGARMAQAGEFTVRAFLAGKMDLSQAEAVADTVAAEDRAAHALALSQMRGGYSSRFAALREELVGLTSLLELELDFSQEDVEFADRKQLLHTVLQITGHVGELLSSFTLGNAIKEGVGVAIVGRPNVGKSTLLNRLVRDERALVSEIAGTTRDVIEERLVIDGVTFRFSDTAGIRPSDDRLERMGIERTFASLRKASVVLLICEPDIAPATLQHDIEELGLQPGQKLCVVINKTDLLAAAASAGCGERASRRASQALAVPFSAPVAPAVAPGCPVLAISAKTGAGVEELKAFLSRQIDMDMVLRGDAVVSSARHYEALQHAAVALERVRTGLESGLPADLLSQDLRDALHHIGTITGAITTDEILEEIFSKFCIGK